MLHIKWGSEEILETYNLCQWILRNYSEMWQKNAKRFCQKQTTNNKKTNVTHKNKKPNQKNPHQTTNLIQAENDLSQGTEEWGVEFCYSSTEHKAPAREVSFCPAPSGKVTSTPAEGHSYLKFHLEVHYRLHALGKTHESSPFFIKFLTASLEIACPDHQRAKKSLKGN